jgi:hypothetical protein
MNLTPVIKNKKTSVSVVPPRHNERNLKQNQQLIQFSTKMRVFASSLCPTHWPFGNSHSGHKLGKLNFVGLSYDKQHERSDSQEKKQKKTKTPLQKHHLLLRKQATQPLLQMSKLSVFGLLIIIFPLQREPILLRTTRPTQT